MQKVFRINWMGKNYTSIYISWKKEEDTYIDNIWMKKVKAEKKLYTKNEIIKQLIQLGINVENGLYIQIDPAIDEFVSQLQNMVIETNGQKFTIKKTKQQVYTMLIEKGLQNLSVE